MATTGLTAPYAPRHLTGEQVMQVYGDALRQAEAAVLSRRIGAVLNPSDAGAQAAYEQAQGQLAALEADLEMLLAGTAEHAQMEQKLTALLGGAPP